MTSMDTKHADATLSAEGLACVRGERRIFEGVRFQLTNGGVLQVSGPNGSGKTSLLRIACGLLLAASGGVEWNGEDVRRLGDEYNRRLAYVGHLNGVKDELDAHENLRFAAQTAGLDGDDRAIDAALREFSIGGLKGVPGKSLSQGQKRRLALARLRLSENRALWILDEPFASLDSAGIEVMREVLERHLQRGGLAVLTTHQEVSLRATSAQRLELAA